MTPHSTWEGLARTWQPKPVCLCQQAHSVLGSGVRGWAGGKEAVKTMETYQGKSCGQGRLRGRVTGAVTPEGPTLGWCFFGHHFEIALSF